VKAPRPSRIDTLSPTLAEILLECSYRAAFRGDPEFNNLDRPNNFQTLGTIRHRVSEAVHKGALNEVELSSVKDAIGDLWDQITAEEAANHASRWSSSELPDVNSWLGYQNARANAKRALTRTITDYRNSNHKLRKPDIENWLYDQELGIRGKPDRIEYHAQGSIIVDIKTGRPEATMKESWRRQLLLYAHLVQKASGETPIAIAIETASGNRLQEAITKKQIRDTVEQSLLLVKKFNEHLANPAQLASPSQENCEYCSYKIHCEPFWEAVQHDWSGRDIRGQIKETLESGATWGVTLTPTSPADWPTKTVFIGPIRTPGVNAASGLSATNVRLTDEPNRVKVRQETDLDLE